MVIFDCSYQPRARVGELLLMRQAQPSVLSDLWIKFYWNTAMPTYQVSPMATFVLSRANIQIKWPIKHQITALYRRNLPCRSLEDKIKLFSSQDLQWLLQGFLFPSTTKRWPQQLFGFCCPFCKSCSLLLECGFFSVPTDRLSSALIWTAVGPGLGWSRWVTHLRYMIREDPKNSVIK